MMAAMSSVVYPSLASREAHSRSTRGYIHPFRGERTVTYGVTKGPHLRRSTVADATVGMTSIAGLWWMDAAQRWSSSKA